MSAEALPAASPETEQQAARDRFVKHYTDGFPGQIEKLRLRKRALIEAKGRMDPEIFKQLVGEKTIELVAAEGCYTAMVELVGRIFDDLEISDDWQSPLEQPAQLSVAVPRQETKDLA